MHTMVRHDEVYNTRVLSNRYYHHFREPFRRTYDVLISTAFPCQLMTLAVILRSTIGRNVSMLVSSWKDLGQQVRTRLRIAITLAASSCGMRNKPSMPHDISEPG